MREPVDENDEQTRRGLLGIYLLSPRHAALEEKKMLFDLPFFFWAVIRLSASMRALFIIFYLRTFFWGGCGSRSLIDAFCYTAYGRMGQREPWALAYSLLDIINLGVL